MDLVKKNIVSILCGVIALVSIVLIFFPFGGMYTALAGEVKKSQKVGDDLHTVATTPRHWPTLSTDPKDQVPLKHFPTVAYLQKGQEITKAWQTQTENLVTKATTQQSTRLLPLVPGALPGGTGQTEPAQLFKTAYARIFASNGGTPTGTGQPGQPPAEPDLKPKPQLGTKLLGRMPPTPADVQAKIAERDLNLQNSAPKDASGQVANPQQLQEQIDQGHKLIPNQLRSDVATGSLVYVDPLQTYVLNDRIAASGGAAPNVDDIFLAQIGLWLQQEVCDAVYETNKGSTKGVLQAPIKRLMAIRFQLPYVAKPLDPGAPADAPAVPAAPTAKVAQNFTLNPVGHTSNDLYDVVPFRLTLVCEAETLPQTLTSLTENRYFTVRNMTVQSVDSATAFSQGFMYGSKPVVQVNLDMQWMLLRKISGPLMPPDIIRGLSLMGTPGAPGVPGA